MTADEHEARARELLGAAERIKDDDSLGIAGQRVLAVSTQAQAEATLAVSQRLAEHLDWKRT